MAKNKNKYMKITPFALAVASVTGAVTALAVTAVKYAKGKAVAVAEDHQPCEAPAASFSATYTQGGAAGYATGTVTVNLPAEDSEGRCIRMYWGDENGRLEGYTALPLLKAPGETTTYTFGKNVMIPAGATRLLVYLADTEGNLSEESISLELPEGAAHGGFEAVDAELWIMSDVHLTTDRNHAHNRNFVSMLRDVEHTAPHALGLFIVGDMANSGQEEEYQGLVALHAEAEYVPPLFLTIGNHDFYNNSFEEGRAKFLRYATLPDGTHPATTTYDFWLGGYHFISLSTDEPDELSAIFHQSTMDWLREKLNENRDTTRPTFLFLHQSMYDTVSGSLPGEGWNGVKNEQILRDVLSDYPEVMFFNGHSHWTLDSVSNMFEGTPELPCRIFNCGSAGYLWTGFHSIGGDHLNGSQGYLVRICDGVLYVLGRDFCTGEWVSAAQYRVDLTEAPKKNLCNP